MTLLATPYSKIPLSKKTLQFFCVTDRLAFCGFYASSSCPVFEVRLNNQIVPSGKLKMSGYDGFYHYLPIENRDMELGLYMTGCGYGQVHPGQNYPPEEHPGIYQFSWNSGRQLPEFQIILITDGRGQFESKATGLVEIKGDTLILLFPGIWHRYRPLKSTGWTERWISLHGEFIHRLYENQSICPTQAMLQLVDRNSIINTFERTLEQIHSDPVHHTPLLSINALELLAIAIDLTRKCKEAPTLPKAQWDRDVDDALVNRALDVIWTRSHRPLSVDQLVSQLPVTRRTLERRMMATLGHSVLDEINRCRLSRAKRLLTETNLPVKSVAYLAGFRDHERLRRLMVIKVGCPPSAYRARTRMAAEGSSTEAY